MDSTPLLMPGEILPVSSSFFIEVDKHIRFVDPKKYKSAEAGIDPMRYFITSGDAVQKIGIMIQHVRTAIKKNKNAYGKALQKMLKEATTLQKGISQNTRTTLLPRDRMGFPSSRVCSERPAQTR